MNKIGFIGLGIMGTPMARQLLKGNFDLLVNDVNKEAVKTLVTEGAIAADLIDIAKTCDIIFTILPNGSIVQEILFGENSIAVHAKNGSIICDMSSVTPVESKECYDKLKTYGIGFIDAPVSGGEPKAIDGTLSFMAGGDEADFKRLLPYFDYMGASAVLVGSSGSGSVTKLANQIIVNNTIAIVSEAFVLAAKAGADPLKVYDAIRGGLAGSAVLDAKLPLMVARNFVPGGKISINHKDIKNVIDTAHAIDVPIPYSAQLFEILQTLKIKGHMNDDHGGIVQYFENLANVTISQTNT